MTTEYLALHPDWTIEQVFNHIRRVGKQKETISILYVVDEKYHLVDEILLREIIMAEPGTRVSDLMNNQFASLQVTDDQETAADVMRRYDLTVLPVVDSEGTLLGIVTADDVFDVVEEETTEDIHRMGGLETLDSPYSKATFINMVQKRGIWLLVLFLGGMITVWAMESFGGILEQIKALAFFIPLIISSGGNSGSQAATLVIRALATQDIQLKDWYRTAGKEILMGITLGSVLCVIAFLRHTLFRALMVVRSTICKWG